jgi:anti-sigma B factor antagonist
MRDGEPAERVVRDGLLELRIDRVAETVIVTLRGELEVANAEFAESELLRLEGEDVRGLVLDLSGLEFCDSRGLAVIARAVSRCRMNGDRLGLLRPGPSVQRLFEVTGMEEQLPFLN